MKIFTLLLLEVHVLGYNSANLEKNQTSFFSPSLGNVFFFFIISIIKTNRTGGDEKRQRARIRERIYHFHFDSASPLFSNHMGKQGEAEAAV